MQTKIQSEIKTYVAYIRVSTQKQGISGLGIEAQTATIQSYAQSKGIVLDTFTEIVSGKKDDRIELQKAISYAKKNNAILLIAKLDRLSRNLLFIATLMESGVQFEACDLPSATPFTLHIFAALAEQERKFISIRTKDALTAKAERMNEIELSAYKAQKATNGTNNLVKGKAAAKAANTHTTNATNNAANTQPYSYIALLREQGKSYTDIAILLTANGYKTPTAKGMWKGMTVKRIYDRHTKKK